MDFEIKIARALSKVKEALRDAELNSVREGEAVTLVAISKTHPEEKILAAIKAGQKTFGENRVQEAQKKWPKILETDNSLTLHLVGSLQRNKVAQAVKLFHVIESIDRVSLAETLAKQMDLIGCRPECYIQVNTGSEPQKAGVLPAKADKFIKTCTESLNLPITGLMCVPPIDEEPSPHFAFLKQIADRNGLKKLSMGMSRDFELAVLFGATHVRVGTAIFGTRV